MKIIVDLLSVTKFINSLYGLELGNMDKIKYNIFDQVP